MNLEVVIQQPTLLIEPVSSNVSLEVLSAPQLVELFAIPQAEAIVPVAFEQRMTEVEGGLIQFNNTLHTEQNPFLFSSGVQFDIPIRNDGGIFDQAPVAFQNLIDNSDSSITVLNVFDTWDMKLVCKIKTDLAERTGFFGLDIGGSIGAFNDFEIKGSPSADQVVKRTIDKWFYQGSTFQANKGFLRGSFDGDGEMYDISLVFNRKRRGQSI